MAHLLRIYESKEQADRSRALFALELQRLIAWFDANDTDDAHYVVGTQQPFMLAYQEHNNVQLLSRYGDLCTRLMRICSGDQERDALRSTRRKGRIRIGIVSAHIREHPVWNAILKGWFLHLTQALMELQVFHLKPTFDRETTIAQ